MFLTAAHDLSICVRCQFRIVIQPRSRQKGSVAPPLLPGSRFLTSWSSPRENVAHSEEAETPSREGQFPHFQERRRRQFPLTRSIPIYQKDSHGVGKPMEALGKPGEVLLVPEDLRPKKTFFPFQMVEAIEGNDAPNPSQIIDAIDAEGGIVNAERVAKNLESIRDTWLKSRSGSPSIAEFDALAKSLYDGFTGKQLLRYYEDVQHSSPPPSHMKLLNPDFTDLYTRSAWNSGSTTFPGEAPARLAALKPEVRLAEGRPEDVEESSPRKYRDKNTLAHKILRDRWHIRTREEMSSSGELDIWLSQEYLELLLTHRRNILQRLTEQYGAKADASRSHSLLRVTSDFDNCCEILNNIRQILDDIHMSEIDFPLNTSADNQSTAHDISPLNRSLLNQLEQLTNTVIRTSSSDNLSGRKLRIYHLGPGKDDLEDVMRLLSQVLQPTTPKESFSFWTGEKTLRDAAPVPIETGKGLRLVARGTKWSRWTCGVARKVELPKEERPLRNMMDDPKPAKVTVMDKHIRESLINSMQSGSSMTATSLYPAVYWRKAPFSEISAVFGYILYPLNASSEMNSIKEGIKTHPEYLAFFDSRRELLTNFSGLRRFLQSVGFKKTEESEELWIRLIPSPTMETQGQASVLPSLELRVLVNADTKKISLAGVRLIVQEREFDLLLPDESTDIRFFSESYVPSGEQVDQRIYKFIKDSNLDVFGEERLKTPTNLSILIPSHAIRRSSANDTNHTNATIEVEPDPLVDYTFANLEHRSSFSGLVSGTRMQYTLIEAGRTGGRREELRIFMQESDADPQQQQQQQHPSPEKIESFHDFARTLVQRIKTVVNFKETVPSPYRSKFGLGVSRNCNVPSNVSRRLLHRTIGAQIQLAEETTVSEED